MWVELYLPGRDRQDSGLRLATVNHDFEGVSSLLSGSCNIDVACGGADGFPWIDNYRDVIRSVGAYTLNGRSQCTGFLVNNANQDGRPLFLTADHCDITAENAASLVVYWNYQQRDCREPGSTSSGATGNGSLDVFNSGASLRANYAASDFSLVELDEPVNPLADAFFAGWSADAPPPVDGVISVHHPGVQEKRISRSEQATTLTDGAGMSAEDTGDYLRVESWTDGSTERGSSGAPLFDPDGRVRGHLFAGLASCTADDFDLFGYFNRDWEGGGTPESRLRDWLDPCGSDRLTIDGLAQADLPFLLSARTHCLTRCAGEAADYEVYVGERFAAGSEISVITDPRFSISAPTTTGGGESFTVTIGDTDGASGDFDVSIRVGQGDAADVLPLRLSITGAEAAPVTLIDPDRDAAAVSPFPTLSWRATDGASGYRLELTTDPTFRVLTGSYRTVTDTTLALRNPLAGATTYHWRVSAVSSCGDGAWSVPASFTTAAVSCILPRAAALPVPISTVDSVQVIASLEVTEPLTVVSLDVQVGIDHTFVGDLEAELVSPTGTIVRLFAPSRNGNLYRGKHLYRLFRRG